MEEDPPLINASASVGGGGGGGGDNLMTTTTTTATTSSSSNNSSSSSSSLGRVVRIHLACIAPLPLGSSLRVTGAHLWDPVELSSSSSYPPHRGGGAHHHHHHHHHSDPTNAKRISKNAGRDAYNSGASGFAGGSLGVGATNVLRENEDARRFSSSNSESSSAAVVVGGANGNDALLVDNETNRGCGFSTQQKQQLLHHHQNIMMGVRDSHSQWYASSVEMVTCPETYPLWRTRRPVIVALTDKATITTTSTSNNSENVHMLDDDDDDEKAAVAAPSSSSQSGIHHHRYRYLVVTPGAETESSHGLMGNVGDEYYSPPDDTTTTDDQTMANMQDVFHKTKISSGNLMHPTSYSSSSIMADTTIPENDNNVMTSNDYGSSCPVTLWENPFLGTTTMTNNYSNGVGEDAIMEDAVSREVSTSALSVYSEATSTRRGNNVGAGGGGMGNTPRDYDLINLPFRTLDIDVATASVVKVPYSSNGRMDDDNNIDEEDEDSSPFSPKYTEDGILIDTWNDCNDVTFQSYRILEGINARRGSKKADDDDDDDEEAGRDLDMASSLSEGGNSMTMAIETEKLNNRIFIVCYHLPVTVSKDPNTGEWTACWAESLLAKTENSSFVSAYNPHWVGTVTTDYIIDENDKQALRSILAAMDCTVLFFDEDVRDAHYKGFCKQVLWLAFHHVDILDMRDPAFSLDLDAASGNPVQPDGTLFDLRSSWDQRTFGRWWEAFKFVNHTFAEEVAKMVTPEDVVWVHDYHLSLLPKLLGDEEEKSNAPRLTKKIFFLHIPFPVSMIFKELECGPAILEGMLNADVVGFHGFTDARHFLSSAKRILGVSHENLVGGLIGVQYKKRIVAVTMSSVSVEPAMVDGEISLSFLLSE